MTILCIKGLLYRPSFQKLIFNIYITDLFSLTEILCLLPMHSLVIIFVALALVE